MATVQDRKAPSAGTKVDPGQNAPVANEGAGYVAPDSLAAESYKKDGAFAENRDAQPNQASSQQATAAPTATPSAHPPGSGTSGSAAPTSGSQGGAAPSYVANLYHADPSGPHGKNLTEGGFDDPKNKDGLKLALESEPGSANDPSRLAETRFERDSAANPSVTGHRQDNLHTATAYDELSSETPS